MAVWRLPRGAQRLVDETGWAASQYTRTAVVASGTAHAKGAWTQIVAATSETWRGFILIVGQRFTAATDSSSLLDIGIGAEGSEVVVLADVPVGYQLGASVPIPLEIPAGVRVAMRRQDAVGGNSTAYALHPFTGTAFGGNPACGAAVTYGTNSSTSKGVSATASAVNTWGDWAEVTSATTAPIRRMLVGIQGNGLTDLGTNSAFSVEIGAGAAGSEVGLTRIGSFTASAELINAYGWTAGLPTIPGVVPLTVNVPEGTRLAARFMSVLATTQNTGADVTIIGMR